MSRKAHITSILGIVAVSVVLFVLIGGPKSLPEYTYGDGGQSSDPSKSSDPRSEMPVVALYDRYDRLDATIRYIRGQESTDSLDPLCRVMGPDGEQGNYGIREIFVADVIRISSYVIDPWDDASCEKGIRIWFDYWAPKVCPQNLEHPGRPGSIRDLYELYRRGPMGYRRWRQAQRVSKGMETVGEQIDGLW